jgi:hypothetical protein
VTSKTLVAKSADESGLADALASWRGSGTDASILTLGSIPVDEVDEFVGIEAPNHSRINLKAPEPVEGEPEGWLYFDSFAAYTEDLVAVRIP